MELTGTKYIRTLEFICMWEYEIKNLFLKKIVDVFLHMGEFIWLRIFINWCQRTYSSFWIRLHPWKMSRKLYTFWAPLLCHGTSRVSLIYYRILSHILKYCTPCQLKLIYLGNFARLSLTVLQKSFLTILKAFVNFILPKIH